MGQGQRFDLETALIMLLIAFKLWGIAWVLAMGLTISALLMGRLLPTRHLAFSMDVSATEWQLVLMDVSRGLSLWQALPLSPLRLQWSADGEKLYIESTQGSQHGVYEWHNGHLTLVSLGQFSSHWVWLPDGSGAAYADAVVTSGDTVRADMFLWQHGEKQQLTNSPFDKYPAAWSPDGTQLAYYLQVSDRFGDLWVLNLITGEHHRIQGTANGVTWSPDGRYLAYMALRPPLSRISTFDVHLYDLVTGEHRRLLPGSTSETSYPSWSPDSQQIAFAMDDKVYTTDLTGSTRELISDPQAFSYFSIWSPDGGAIAYLTGSGSINLYVAEVGAYVRSLPRLVYAGLRGAQPVWRPN